MIMATEIFTSNLGGSNPGAGAESPGAYLNNFVYPYGTIYLVNDPKVTWASRYVGPFMLEEVPPEQPDFRYVNTAGGNVAIIQYMDADIARRVKRPRWRATFPYAKQALRHHVDWLYNRNETFLIIGVHAWAALQRERMFQSPDDATQWETHLGYIRDGSYTIYLNEVALSDGVDYEMDINLGQVTLTGAISSTDLLEATYLRDVCVTITNIQTTFPNGFSQRNPRYDLVVDLIEDFG